MNYTITKTLKIEPSYCAFCDAKGNRVVATHNSTVDFGPGFTARIVVMPACRKCARVGRHIA
jgi:hypothetical protein